jgi:hypothetical protein
MKWVLAGLAAERGTSLREATGTFARAAITATDGPFGYRSALALSLYRCLTPLMPRPWAGSSTTVSRRAGLDARRFAQAFRPRPAHRAAPGFAPARRSGRHSGARTSPGSTISRPSKNRST